MANPNDMVNAALVKMLKLAKADKKKLEDEIARLKAENERLHKDHEPAVANCMHCLEECRLNDLIDEDCCPACIAKGHVTPWGVGKCPECNAEFFRDMDKIKAKANAEVYLGQEAEQATNRVELGVIEFHSEQANPGLIERFAHVTKDLRDAACIVDLWLMDIAATLKEFGYEMRVYRTPEKQAEWEKRRENR